ncbi:TIM-barrel domain-containing protein [Cohnella sp. LGH]|uniref:TIM-barrel domain-containing protein n=1 Tax=Cohnella sp. LGH TaxID=1619153 RepID=UPI001FFDF491|nr:TIM-barrel domain-containing protein [Cohnella sp. LGH]
MIRKMIGKKLRKGFLVALTFSLVLSVMTVYPAAKTNAYVSALGNVIGVSVTGDALTLTIDNGAEPNDDILEILAADLNILKVNYRPNGVASSASTPMIDPNRTWSAVGATIDTTGDPILITTSVMRIEIAKNPARMTVKKADGTTLLWEPAGGGVFYDGVRFQHSTGHNMYGIRSYNAFDGEGDILRNDSDHAAHAGEQGDAGGPFIWSTSGYGVLVDSDGGYPYTNSTTGQLEFYYGGTPTEGRRYSKSNVEYYIMLGDPYQIMGAYSKISGAAPLMPKWSLGFSNFEWGIDQDELEEMVELYRAKNIPIDGYALDYDWKKYGEDHYGEFKWNTGNFPDAATNALKSDMDAKGIKLIGITKPRVVTLDFGNNRTDQYDDAQAGGYWYPGHSEYTDYFIPVTVRSVDPYNASARTWLWQNSEEALDKGIVGWWNDETDKVSSGMAQYWFGNFMTGHWSQAFYEGQRAYTDDALRVWQTARTYYPGAQRYATTLWSGDIGIQFQKGEHVSWAAGMKEQRAVMLSSVNLGQAKWGMDAGGFNQENGTIGNPTPELYARWLQFAAMTPVFRVHGNYNQQRQPWYYGSTAEEVSKSAIQFRYSLLPYLYAYERKAYENGAGLVRPLAFDYPADANVANRTDAWMFGDWLMAAPVVDKQQKSKAIYLPAGTWTDYFRGVTYAGGQTIHYPLNSESWTDIPLFIKQGAIIPSQQVQDYVGQRVVDTVNVDVFPSATATSFAYYEDDGKTYDYEGGTTFEQTLTAQDNGGSGYAFSVGAKSGTYVPDVDYYLVKLHGKAGTGATLNGSALASYADLNALKAAGGEGWSTGRDVYGLVTYVKVASGAGSAKNVVVTGSGSVASTAYQYEAEEASLSGDSTGTMAGVNTNHSGYAGSGFVDGLDDAGAAATFYADVRTGGDYEVALRYANATGSAKTLSIFVNGARVKTTSLGQLANWDTWGTQTETLPLMAGRNAITYKYDAGNGDTGNVNLDYMAVSFDPIQAKYEAENAKLSGGASTNEDHWFYSGSAFVDGFGSSGASAEFQVEVPSAGSYEVALRYANGSGSAKTVSLFANGVKDSQLSLSSPSVNWNIWQDKKETVSLNAGTNTVTVKYDTGDTGGVNLDRILVSPTAVVPAASETNLLDNPGFERNTAFNSNWAEWHPGGQALAYGIDSGKGMNPPEAPSTGWQRAYFYAPGAYKQSIHQQVDVPVNNANYKFEARVRLSNTAPTTARAEISNHGGSAQYYNISNDGVWKSIRIDNIYVTTGVVDVGFYVDSPGGTTLLIDDVRLTPQ